MHFYIKAWRFVCTLHTSSKVTVDKAAIIYKLNSMEENKRMGGKIGDMFLSRSLYLAMFFKISTLLLELEIYNKKDQTSSNKCLNGTIG